ncbi:hypothetical protein DPMN_059110 [Dreissena polymorpha]|uniref:Uncharacterized protein n=1 Tax=Dreissena polymorpha TaxID=45954 RepID=A0A9D4HGA1_DREPO|nr:hypothetical protein DPMN_059110 [Dreissena polymorpha]
MKLICILSCCSRLGNFVKLVDQMIVEHMFHLTKTQVTLFVRDVLDVGQTTLRDGFFKANLVFTRHGRQCCALIIEPGCGITHRLIREDTFCLKLRRDLLRKKNTIKVESVIPD